MSCVGTLANSYTGVATSLTPVTCQNSGRYVVIISATTFATTNILQILARDGTWATVQSLVPGLNTMFFTPGGSFRLLMTGTAPVALNADMYQV